MMDYQGCTIFQVEANRGGGAYIVGPDFISFVSLATSPAQVDGARFIKVAGRFGDERGELTRL